MKFNRLAFIALALFASCTQPETNNENEDPGNNQEEPGPAPAPVVVDENMWISVSDGDKNRNPASYATLSASIALGTEADVRTWSGSAWKNDHAASRIDIATIGDAYPQTAVEVTDLTGDNGAKIAASNVTATYLDAISTLTEAYPDINYMAYDVISRKTVRDLEKEKIYSIWVNIFVPAGTAKGVYRGKVNLRSEERIVATVDYELEVFDFTLTNPEEWETFLDLWETPFASNRYYSGKTNAEFFEFTTPERQDTNPFSLYYKHLDPKYQAGLESELELYHKAGGNCITAQIVEDPHNSRLPCASPSLVKWILKKDGTFTWDYTDFDYWVDLNIKHGIDRQIDLFYHTGVGWGFIYYDESLERVDNRLSAQPGTQGWRDISKIFLQDLVNHLEEKGWFDIAVLYMDERLYEVTLELVQAAEAVHNSKGVALKGGGAVNGDECAPLYDRMYDVSLWENHSKKPLKELAESRRAKGLQTTLYTCGSGKMSTPNQPAESAFAVYEAKKYSMDGVMRWALNRYDEDPLHGTVHPTCYPGDCYLIYPDEKDSPAMQAQSSPRFEKLCEGMRTTEKLNLIKKNYPQYAPAVEEIIASLESSYVKAAANMRQRVRNLSAAVQDGKPAPALSE